jgi:hypothetical protein
MANFVQHRTSNIGWLIVFFWGAFLFPFLGFSVREGWLPDNASLNVDNVADSCFVAATICTILTGCLFGTLLIGFHQEHIETKNALQAGETHPLLE